MNKKNVCIIGAGQLGSRHLQALKSVRDDLNITVVDPSESSLRLAKERFEGVQGKSHMITYIKEIPDKLNEAEIVIVASNSNVRRIIVENLLKHVKVKYLILEKILFNKISDYEVIENLISRTNTKTYVNCAMRMIPFYATAKEYFHNQKVTLLVTGSQYGLASNAIHYLDLMAFYTGDTNLCVDLSLADFTMIDSKRSGFKEISGTLIAQFSNGSKAILNCFEDGRLPFQIEIVSAKTRLISKEWEQKAWISVEKNNWEWKEVDAKILYQSQLTGTLVEDLLNHGHCNLVSFEESKKIHLSLLEGFNRFFKKHNLDIAEFPFT